MIAARTTRNTGRKSPSKDAAALSTVSIPLQLRMITVEMRCALSAVTVAAHALCEQNADIDADVAIVLQRGAAAPLHGGLERIESLLKELEDGRAAGVDPAEDCMH